MAKKTHVKVRLVPEAKPDSQYFYYVKKPAGGEKAKVKSSLTRLDLFLINPSNSLSSLSNLTLNKFNFFLFIGDIYTFGYYHVYYKYMRCL